MITLRITKPNGYVYDEEFDTVRDAAKCTQYLPKGSRWTIWRGNDFIKSGWQ